MDRKKNMLLHSCCGPCSTAVIERLADRFHLTVYFYNPNITNEGEYRKRFETEQQFIAAYNEKLPDDAKISLREGPYDPETFIKAVRGLEKEPENGSRCEVCFRVRLRKTAEAAAEGGFDIFATTLSVSPHKNTEVINRTGYGAAEEFRIDFLDESFKKKDGFRRSTEMSREYGLYRQNYCGCIFSERPGAGAENPLLERGPII